MSRFPGHLNVGIAWVDRENRLDLATVLALCGDEPMLESSKASCSMGVDTGREMHVVISRKIPDSKKRRIVYLGVHRTFQELDEIMKRFSVRLCVIDALPETHATRSFALRHRGRVWMNYFNEHQKGADKWDAAKLTVQENRTEVLDYSRRIIRQGRHVLPRRSRLVEEFARHLAADSKVLHEDEDTGARTSRYVKTGPNHFSLAFTYDCLAAARLAQVERSLFTVVNIGTPGIDRDRIWLPLTPYDLMDRGRRW